MTKEEKNYSDNFLKPLLEAIARHAGNDFSYENREAQLRAMNAILKQKGVIKNASEGYKADGILINADHEFSLMEIYGPYKNRSR